MPRFDWAIATDGFLGAILGGAVTGGAIFLTIRHDREVRRDDRIEASAEKVLWVCSEFIALLMTASHDDELRSKMSDMVHAALIFEARLRRRKATVRRGVVEHLHQLFSAAVLDRYPDSQDNAPETAPFDEQTRLGLRNGLGAYTGAVVDLLNARRYLGKDLGSVAARLAEFDD